MPSFEARTVVTGKEHGIEAYNTITYMRDVGTVRL